MKKIFLSIVLLMLIVITLSGCNNKKPDNNPETIIKEKDIIIDYSSSNSFEKDLNEGKEINGKIVKVLIREVLDKKDNLSKFKAGSNLVFIGNEKIDFEIGDYIVLEVEESPTKRDDDWQIRFKMIKLLKQEKSEATNNDFENNNSNNSENNTNNEELNVNEEPVIEDNTIKMDNDSSKYIGLGKEEVEKELKEKGFSNIEMKESKTKDANNKDNSVVSITINEKEFKKDDEFTKDAKVVITYWKYEKTSEYEMAFARTFKNPDDNVYMLFDTDNKKIVYFASYGSVMRTTYTGKFDNGIDINWESYQKGWHEKFIYKGGNKGTLIDGHKDNWEFEKMDVEKAESILNSLNN